MKAWEEFLTACEKEFGEATTKKWLRTLKVVKFDAQNIYLEAKDSFQALWFEEHVRKKLDLLRNNNFRKVKVHLALGKSFESLKTKLKKNAADDAPRFYPIFDEINPQFSLDGFYISQENEISCRILTEPFQFNPTYIYGPPGTGKTHLLMAMTLKLGGQGLKVTFAKTETFTQHVVSAIRASEMGLFREAYRNIDVLILDDVHELAHKGATQEELFHTFNTLHLAGKQIILSGNVLPSDLQFIEPRLISRFEWGITLPLTPYTPSDLAHILDLKLFNFKFPLQTKVKEYLVETFKSGTKALTQAIEALILRAHVNKVVSTSMTPPLVKHYLSDLIKREEEVKLTPQKIIQAVAEEFGIRAEDILGNSQTKESTFPRQIAMYFCRHNLKLPFKKIGDIFARDHSTVMSSVKLIQKSYDDKTSEVGALFPQILKRIH